MPEYRDKPILNDWTNCTLILDLTNSLGEEYHFEIEPEADASLVPTRPAGDDTVLNMYLPLLDQLPHPSHSPAPSKGKGKSKKG